MRSPLRRTSAALILGAAIGLTCAAALAAAAQTTGVIRGKVTDAATGRPVDGAQGEARLAEPLCHTGNPRLNER